LGVGNLQVGQNVFRGQMSVSLPAYIATAPATTAPYVIRAAGAEKSILIEGSRNNRAIQVDGVTQGIDDGTVVKPWLRFPGQTGFTAGVAQRSVTDSAFSWGRNTGKRTAVEFRTLDGLRSNAIIIEAR
jgi:hypothetical protein